MDSFSAADSTLYRLLLLNPWLFAAILNTALLGIVALLPKKLLTPAGLVHAWILGVLIWGCLGWRGYLIVAFYFIVGSGVTRIGLAQKEAAGIAEKRSGARGPENVWGSALTASICGLGVLISQTFAGVVTQDWIIPALLLGYVASFSTKLSDTCASEVGKAYGQRTFLITTLQPVPRGTEGAVSLEGTLAGIVASLAIALVGWGVGLIDGLGIGWCVVAALIATNLESVIGATLQHRINWLTNEIVNIINTLIGAGVAIALILGWNYLRNLT
ncbi:MAG: TIGR00297 family protein [Oscillatoriales cyanobacterium RM2_1_1]|nr:TIGR00297 family protein [Oscillatoriales cyanobacterium SM2_3_0]NJO46049.1 TIGR00297 family protein [Oscillatoriales cyanobacterium RM2_1_1]